MFTKGKKTPPKTSAKKVSATKTLHTSPAKKVPAAKSAGAKKASVASGKKVVVVAWEGGLRRVCDGYNMIDTEMVVSKCKKNPGAECAALKAVCHDALRQGKAAVALGNLKQANSNFALAYQAR